jgi:hypothetical protein
VSLGGPRRRSASDARGFLGKAADFLEVAEQALEEGRLSPAVSLAIHAGIDAADAICVVKLGTTWSGDNHAGAVDHLRQADKKAATYLSRLLGMKTRSEYDSVDPSRSQADSALRAARRFVEIAGTVVHSTDKASGKR